MKIANHTGITEYYQQTKVVNNYISLRFSDPLNVVEHKRQVELVNRIIRETGSTNILEFAPGPARITAELEIEDGTSIDSSKKMIALAKIRMQRRRKNWKFIQGDLFNLKISQKVDFIFGIRFFLHFKRAEREKIYYQAFKTLKPRGFLVMEVMNKSTVLPLRRLMGNKRYRIYDKLYTKEEFKQEMNANGFKVLRMYPILNHFWIQAVSSRPFKIFQMDQTAENIIQYWENKSSSQPYEWIALCQKE